MADRLDVVAVGVEDEGAVVVGVIVGAQAGSPVLGAAGGERGGVEGIDFVGRAGGEGEVDAADRGTAAGGEPKEGLATSLRFGAEAEHSLELHHRADPEWGQGRFVESAAAFQVADLETGVVEHRFSLTPIRCDNRAVSDGSFQEPGWFTKNVFNRLVALATKLGLSVAGSRVLEVKGRKSGEWRRTPVNLLEFGGARYLVAPRGNTQWVRNMRVSGGGRLVLGRRTEEFTAKEVPEAERVPLLRAYLEKWKWEVGAFFGGVGPDASDAELRRIAPDHPAFRID